MSLFGMDLFDLFDFVTGQLMLPICGLLMCLFVGWVIPKQIVKDELSNWGTLRFSFYKLFLFTMRFVCPLCILAIMLHQFHLIYPIVSLFICPHSLLITLRNLAKPNAIAAGWGLGCHVFIT